MKSRLSIAPPHTTAPKEYPIKCTRSHPSASRAWSHAVTTSLTSPLSPRHDETPPERPAPRSARFTTATPCVAMSVARPCIISGAPPNFGCACTITTPCFSRSRDGDVASAPRFASEASCYPFPVRSRTSPRGGTRTRRAPSRRGWTRSAPRGPRCVAGGTSSPRNAAFEAFRSAETDDSDVDVVISTALVLFGCRRRTGDELFWLGVCPYGTKFGRQPRQTWEKK